MGYYQSRMVVCATRELPGKVAAGAEEDEGVQLDSQTPSAIPWTRMERMTRQTFCPTQRCSTVARTTVNNGASSDRFSALEEKREREGREWGK